MVEMMHMAHLLQAQRAGRSLGIHILLAIVIMAGACRTSAAQAGAAAAAKRWQMGAPIVSYWAGPAPMTDAAAKQMAEGNSNLVWVAKTDMPAGADEVAHCLAQLDILQRHGLRGILALGIGRNPDDPKDRRELDAIVEGVRNHPALYAYHLKDEPQPTLFPRLARLRAYLQEKDPSRLVYVNLLPTYATNKQLGIRGEPVAAYREYVRQFVEVVKPQLLSYDHYHFAVKGDGDKYFLNLAEMRQAALAADLPYMAIVQACSWTVNMRIPTGEELRWLAYTALAYGSQGISWYVYCCRGHDGAMMNLADGSPTSLYYTAQHVNKEFAAIATELQPLRSLAVYHAGMLPEGTSELPATAPFRLDPLVPQKKYATPVEGFVIGYFGKGPSPTHALAVNLDYRTYSGLSQPRRDEFLKPVQRFLVGPGRLEVFNAATSKWSAADADRVELRLPPGGGILVRAAQ